MERERGKERETVLKRVRGWQGSQGRNKAVDRKLKGREMTANNVTSKWR